MKSIFVAFPNIENGRRITGILKSNGYNVAVTHTSGYALVQSVSHMAEALVVCGARFADTDASTIRRMLPEQHDMIVVNGAGQAVVLNGTNILTLFSPIKTSELLGTVAVLMATSMFFGRHKLQQSSRERDPDERQIIEKAKAVLMDRHRMTEAQAHRFIQKRSMDAALRSVQVARLVLWGW